MLMYIIYKDPSGCPMRYGGGIRGKISWNKWELNMVGT